MIRRANLDSLFGMRVAPRPGMLRDWLRSLTVLGAISVSWGPVACGAGDSPAGASLDGETPAPDLPPLAEIGPCVEAEIKACRVDLPNHGANNPTANCFVGVQICTDGVWSDCVEEEELDELMVEPDEDGGM